MGDDSSFAFLRALNKFISNRLRGFVLIDGIVTEVNDNFTVDIEVNEVPFSGVPVSVLIGSQSSIYEVPVIGSACLVKFRDGHRNLPQIDSFAQVDKYYISPVTELFISSKKIQFNQGTNGGLPLTPDLVTRLNKIEQQQNQILDILKTLIVPSTPYDAGALFSSLNDLTLTLATDIQSTVITQ